MIYADMHAAMLIHCTKRLAARLPGVSSQPLADDNPLGSWHAHHYTIDHRSCVLFCHDTTRFTLFLAGLKKREFQDLSPWFQDLFLNTLLRMGCEDELISKAADLLDGLRFDTHTDRSVLATLNTVRNYDLAALLWPDRAMPELLQTLQAAELGTRSTGDPQRRKGFPRFTPAAPALPAAGLPC